VFTHTFEINANPGLQPPAPLGPLVPPGAYTLRLTVDGKTYTQPVTVVNDPRSPATVADVRAQYALETRVVAAMQTAWDGYQQVAAAGRQSRRIRRSIPRWRRLAVIPPVDAASAASGPAGRHRPRSRE